MGGGVSIVQYFSMMIEGFLLGIHPVCWFPPLFFGITRLPEKQRFQQKHPKGSAFRSSFLVLHIVTTSDFRFFRFFSLVKIHVVHNKSSKEAFQLRSWHCFEDVHQGLLGRKINKPVEMRIHFARFGERKGVMDTYLNM